MDTHNNSLKELIDYIGIKNPLQKKYLVKSLQDLTECEKAEIQANIEYYLVEENMDIPYLGDSYLMFITDTLKETKFFVEHGCYRYSKQKEVADNVYYNQEYMRRYVTGINLSGYLWTNHRNLHRYYRTVLSNAIEGENYLEIGTGHGQYFLEAINSHKYKNFFGVDISPASVVATKKYVESHYEVGCIGGGGWNVACEDFLKFDDSRKFDMISMGEVLEHVEEPMIMLRKICSLLTENGRAYITTVINGPTVDHIYLYRTIGEVLDMMVECGFSIVDYYCTTAGNISLEKAIRKSMCINIALLLKKG